MASEPKVNDFAQSNGAGAGNVNPNNANPANIPAKDKAAIANAVAPDAAQGQPVHVFDPNAKPEEKAAAAKRGGFIGGAAKGVFGAPKALGKGVVNVGQGVTKGVVNVGNQGVGAVGSVGRGVVDATGKVAKGAVDVTGSVAGGARDLGTGVVGAGASGVKNLVGNVPGMGALKDDKSNRAVAVGIDTSSAGAPVPTVTIEDAEKTTVAAAKPPTENDIPGTIPMTVLPGVPDWMPIGWKQVAGIEGRGIPDAKTAEQLDILSNFLSDQYYGQWYHNAGVIVFAVVATRLATALRLSWAWVCIILAICATFYTISIKRTRVRARDDIQRELVKTRLITETESADWLNGFLDRFWLIYEPVLSATIVGSVDAALVASTPGFLDSIRLTTFTLGNKAPRIDYVRTFPKTPDDVVVMDWALSFTPNDIQDITPRQAAKRINPKIVLTVRVGKGVVSAGMPIMVEDINFSGKMRIKLQLMTAFPHVQRVEMSFLEEPMFDFVLKPIGGETFGFDIASMPGLAPFIRSQVHGALRPMMYDPNVFTLDLEQMLAGAPLDAASGVVKVTILDGKGFTASKLGGGAPDPYVAVALGAKPPVARTKIINGTTTPTFNETQFILIKSLNDVLNFNVFDYNEHRPDSLLGTVSQELKVLGDDAEQEGIVGHVLDGGKEKGQLRYDLSYFPVLQPTKRPDGTLEPPPESNTGIARITVHGAKDFDKSGDINSVANVFLGNSKTPVLTTDTAKKTNNPAWESHTEFLVSDKNASVITVNISDSKTQSNLGRVSVKLMDIIASKEKGNDWFPLAGTKAGKIRLSADFRPVAMAGAIDSAAAYTAPIGILRLWIKNAQDVKNVELGGKSDPYVRVQSNNKTLARTEVINNNLNPEWDQIVYVPVHSLRQRVTLELMDYENVGKDRSLGYVELNVADCAEPNPEDVEWPYKSTGSLTRSDKIFLGKANQYKGTLNYEVDFKPAISLRGGVSFDAKKNELEVAAEQKKAKEAANGANGATAAAGAAASAAAPSDVAPAPSKSDPAPTATAAVAKEAVDPAKANAPSTKDAKEGDEETAAADPEVGVELTSEELLGFQSGIIVFQIISGRLARKGALEIMLDDGYWPVYTSDKARSTHATWDQVGEGFVRELDFGRVWLRINANDLDSKEDIVGELTMDTKEFLETALNDKAEFILTGPDGSRSSVMLSARYLPINIKLQPRESINDQGLLKVTVIGGKNLASADRSGKSDPNITFLLNGHKVFKSQTVKKTLNPVWNETFDTVVPSRVRAKLQYEVNDWNQLGTAEELGSGLVDLAQLEPFELLPVDLPVALNGKPAGSVQLKLLFTPQIIARTRGKTSTFSSAGRTVTNIGGAALGAPVAVGKGLVHGVGAVGGGVVAGGGAIVGGVGHGVGAIVGAPGKLFGRKNKGTTVQQNAVPTTLSEESGYQVPAGQQRSTVAAGQVSAPAGAVAHGLPGSDVTTLPAGEGQAPEEPGMLTVAVLSAKDIQPAGSHNASSLKPYVQLKVGSKSYKTDHQKGVDVDFNETFNFNILPGTNSFSLAVFDKHSLGKDVELGTGEVDIWRHLQPAVPTADVLVELVGGGGLVKLRLDWQAGVGSKGGLARNRSRTPSVSSKNGEVGTPSRSKFGMTPKKEPSS
ncbi:Tricalbin-2 [Vanrija albida]|uniref:Tricalbin-2 n=1 Tax=Vanrija albida TaxID=181172 RepID=A0ABR3QDC2_9TREE